MSMGQCFGKSKNKCGIQREQRYLVIFADMSYTEAEQRGEPKKKKKKKVPMYLRHL